MYTWRRNDEYEQYGDPLGKETVADTPQRYQNIALNLHSSIYVYVLIFLYILCHCGSSNKQVSSGSGKVVYRWDKITAYV